MSTLYCCNGVPSLDPQFHFSTPNLHFSHLSFSKRRNSLILNPKLSQRRLQITNCAVESDIAANTIEVDMVKTKDGAYTAAQQKVMVAWDLDNKPPTSQAFNSATALKEAAELFGTVVDFSAYANEETFSFISDLVIDGNLDKQTMSESGALKCKLCRKMCETKIDLKKHFVKVHERERHNRLKHLKALNWKKKQRYREECTNNDHKYDMAVSDMFEHSITVGLEMELRRAGVRLRKVKSKRKSADKVLMNNVHNERVSFLVLVSDDSRFSDVLTRAKISNLSTVVVGKEKSLEQFADYWLSWSSVESGSVSKNDLKRITHKGDESFNREDELVHAFYEEEEDDDDFEDGDGYGSDDIFWESDDGAEEVWTFELH